MAKIKKTVKITYIFKTEASSQKAHDDLIEQMKLEPFQSMQGAGPHGSYSVRRVGHDTQVSS